MFSFNAKLIVATILILLFFIPSFSSSQDKWDTKEKVLMGSFIMGQIINYGQVNYTLSDPYWEELNLLIVDERSLIAVKLLGTGMIYYISHSLPHKWRKIVLMISNIVVWGCVIHDYHVGVKFSF